MKLVRVARGREEVILEGDQKVLRRKMAATRTSQRGGVSGRGGKKYRAEYRIEP